jgi:hypothetical protein
MRKPHSLLLAAALAVAVAAPARAELKLPRVSQNASVTQTIGTTDLSIKYCRPGVKGRTIWGALVPFGTPWRTGANEITSFTTTDAITVEGQPLPAGTYGIVTIPGAEEWIVAFSKQKEMWGSTAYDPKQDQLRVTVKPQPAEATEWMQFTFEATTPDACELALRWEKVRVPVRIAVDVKGYVLANVRASVAEAKPDDWRTFYRAANYANDNGLVPTEVTAWAATALKAQVNFNTLALSAKLARKAGQNQTAVAQMTKAIELAKADKEVEPAQIAPLEKLLTEWTAKP